VAAATASAWRPNGRAPRVDAIPAPMLKCSLPMVCIPNERPFCIAGCWASKAGQS
jgi:hypothetical protein